MRVPSAVQPVIAHAGNELSFTTHKYNYDYSSTPEISAQFLQMLDKYSKLKEVLSWFAFRCVLFALERSYLPIILRFDLLVLGYSYDCPGAPVTNTV